MGKINLIKTRLLAAFMKKEHLWAVSPHTEQKHKTKWASNRLSSKGLAVHAGCPGFNTQYYKSTGGGRERGMDGWTDGWRDDGWMEGLKSKAECAL